jgi:hypothetical protein
MFPFHEIFYSNKNSYEVLKVAFSKAGLLEEMCRSAVIEDNPVVTNFYVMFHFHITSVRITRVV